MNNEIYSLKLGNTTIQFIKYVLIGIFNNSLGYSIFLIITWMGFQPKLAMTILYFISTTFNFFGMRKWVFTNNMESTIYRTAWRFFIVYFGGYLINLTILVEFSDKLGYSYQLVQAAAIGVVVVYLFINLKFFVFPTREIIKN